MKATERDGVNPGREYDEGASGADSWGCTPFE